MSKVVLSVCKHNFFLFFLISLLFLIGCKAGITGHAVSKVSIINTAPLMNSVNTFSLYVSSDDNIQEDNFTICSNKDTKKVHMNVKASDADGFGNITNVTFKIVLLSGTTESDFNRFGNDFINLIFESGSGANAIYKFAFNMSINDPERKDPLFYRIKSKVSDGISTSVTLDKNYIFIKETCGEFTNDSFIAIVNETTIIDGTQDADTSIEIVTNATVNGSFSITKTTVSPVNFTDFGVVALNKYIDIALTPVINQSLTSIKIKIHYTDAEVSAAGIEESSLEMYNWNGTNWTVIDNSTADAINNFVSGTVEHFSLYALFGNASVSVSAVEPSVEVEEAEKGGVGFIIPSIKLDADLIKVSLKEDESKTKFLNIINDGNTKLELNLIIRDLEDFVSLSDDLIILAPGETKVIALKFNGKLVGIYSGKLLVKGDGVSESVNLIVEVESKEILFGIALDLIKTKIGIWDDLNVKISLINFGVPGRVNVSLFYTIKDLDNNIVLKETETTEVGAQKEFVKTFKLPSDIAIGDYLISAELRYANTTATSSASFEITKRPVKLGLPLIVSFIILILILIILTIIHLREYKEIKYITKINEILGRIKKKR